MGVLIGFNHPDRIHAAFATSLLGLLVADRYRTIDGTLAVESSSFLVAGRNDMARAFLNSRSEWLLAVDTDMVLPCDIVPRLLKHARPDRIVGGLCYCLDRGRELPVLFDDVGDRMDWWTPGAVVPVGAIGMACAMIHRSVFKRLEYPYFRGDPAGRRDQDQLFCDAVRAAGVGIAVDTSTVIGHVKQQVLTGQSAQSGKLES